VTLCFLVADTKQSQQTFDGVGAIVFVDGRLLLEIKAKVDLVLTAETNIGFGQFVPDEIFVLMIGTQWATIARWYFWVSRHYRHLYHSSTTEKIAFISIQVERAKSFQKRAS
jgi:hypothetical protein